MMRLSYFRVVVKAGKKIVCTRSENVNSMTKYFQLLVISVFSFCIQTQAQQTNSINTKKGVLYFAFGSHRIFYTPSTIRFVRGSNPSFDFTLEKVKAQDEGGLKFETAPQFTYTVGYYFKNKNFGIEYQYDHIKYFVKQNQVVHMTGTIENKSYNQDTTITADFVKMEHSDGGNYAMLNFVKWANLISNKEKEPMLQLIMKAGAGVGIPKTNTTIMGNHRDDRYHVSGYIVGIESGLRYSFWKYAFVSGTFKGVYANYNHFLIAGGYGSQKWFSAQLIYMLGLQFPL